MKVKLNINDSRIVLSDEHAESDSFVNIKIVTNYGEADEYVRISDLMPALIAFDAKRSRRLSDERDY